MRLYTRQSQMRGAALRTAARLLPRVDLTRPQPPVLLYTRVSQIQTDPSVTMLLISINYTVGQFKCYGATA